MYATILVAADLAASDRAKEVLARAQELCDPNGTIRLLHVMTAPATGRLRASAMASILALSTGTDPRILPVLREGEVAPQILAIAKADRADLVILGKDLPELAAHACTQAETCAKPHTEICVLVACETTPERTTTHV